MHEWTKFMYMSKEKYDKDAPNDGSHQAMEAKCIWTRMPFCLTLSDIYLVQVQQCLEYLQETTQGDIHSKDVLDLYMFNTSLHLLHGLYLSLTYLKLSFR